MRTPKRLAIQRDSKAREEVSKKKQRKAVRREEKTQGEAKNDRRLCFSSHSEEV